MSPFFPVESLTLEEIISAIFLSTKGPIPKTTVPLDFKSTIELIPIDFNSFIKLFFESLLVSSGNIKTHDSVIFFSNKNSSSRSNESFLIYGFHLV